jgi:hypothetical protein
VPGDAALTADGRDLELVSGPAKIVQNIKVRAGIFKGSWRYDRQLGVPYFDEILVFGATAELVRRRFQQLIAQTDGVLSVTSLTVRFDQPSETIFVTFSAISDTSEVIRDVLSFQAT